MRADSHGAPVSDGQVANSESMLATIQAGACPQCVLDQARDRADVARWLARRGLDAHDALGVVCCPAHTWRLALDAEEPATVERLAALYAHALNHLLHDAKLALARLERTGAARWLQLPGALTPGWFSAQPPCPLCARAARTDEAHDPFAVALDEWMASQSAEARAEIARQACGAHRTEGDSATEAADAADAAHARWWLAPGARAQDVAFIRRLLRAHDEPRFPDDLCPLCAARVRHERALIAALAAGESFEAVSLTPAEGWAEAAPERSARRIERIDPAMLCGRHTALLRAPAGSTPDESLGEQLGEQLGEASDALIAQALAGDAPGALRAQTNERECPACAILHAWELARIEGLHRAAGGAPLSESTTARLIWELEHARYPFCAPHLRRLLRFGPAETTWSTLGPSLTRTWEEARDRVRSGQHRAFIGRVAAATLAGLPA